jgi:hypothetical protein
MNLLRNARANPHLSSYAYLHGNFDSNKTPLAPPGTKVVVHSKPDKRASWDPHGIEGWFVGPSMEHYRCVKCYMPLTSSVRDSDTVAFFPHHIPFPKVTTNDFLRQSIEDILSLLKNSPPTTIPSLTTGDNTKAAIAQIAKLLNRHIPAPPSIPSLSPTPDPLPRVYENTQKDKQVPIPENFTPIQPIQTITETTSLPRVKEKPKSTTETTSLPRMKVKPKSTSTKNINRANQNETTYQKIKYNLPSIHIPTPKATRKNPL